MSFASSIVSTHELRLLPTPSVVQRPSLMEAKALSQLVNDSRHLLMLQWHPVAAFLSHRAKELEHPAWITFSCKSGTEVSSGDLLADCIKAVGSEWVIGALAEKHQDVSNRGPPNSELRRKAPLSSNFSVL